MKERVISILIHVSQVRKCDKVIDEYSMVGLIKHVLIRGPWILC